MRRHSEYSKPNLDKVMGRLYFFQIINFSDSLTLDRQVFIEKNGSNLKHLQILKYKEYLFVSMPLIKKLLTSATTRSGIPVYHHSHSSILKFEGSLISSKNNSISLETPLHIHRCWGNVVKVNEVSRWKFLLVTIQIEMVSLENTFAL